MSFNAILFPADDSERAPHVVSLMTSSASPFPPLGQSGSQQPLPSIARIPRPEVYMDFIAEDAGSRAWQSHVSLKFAPRYYLLVSIRTPAFHFSFTLTFSISLRRSCFVSRSGCGWRSRPFHTSLHFFPDSPNANQTNLTRGPRMLVTGSMTLGRKGLRSFLTHIHPTQPPWNLVRSSVRLIPRPLNFTVRLGTRKSEGCLRHGSDPAMLGLGNQSQGGNAQHRGKSVRPSVPGTAKRSTLICNKDQFR